jgi:predicted O-methyltransferase YrrM
VKRPPALDAIRRDTEAIGFTMASDPEAGELLRTLAATKSSGRLLELGTGTGIGTSWILDGLSPNAILTTVDTDERMQSIARKHLGRDPRVRFHLGDGGAFLEQSAELYDLIYADAWPGKFTHLDRALARLSIGGIYFIDDLLPRANWPEGHGAKVDALVGDLERRAGFLTARLAWSSGLMIVVKGRDQV